MQGGREEGDRKRERVGEKKQWLDLQPPQLKHWQLPIHSSSLALTAALNPLNTSRLRHTHVHPNTLEVSDCQRSTVSCFWPQISRFSKTPVFCLSLSGVWKLLTWAEVQVVRYSAKVIWIWICVNYSVWKPHFHDMFRRGSRSQIFLPLPLCLHARVFFVSLLFFFSLSLFVFLLLLCLTRSVFSFSFSSLPLLLASSEKQGKRIQKVEIPKGQVHFRHLRLKYNMIYFSHCMYKEVTILDSFYTKAGQYCLWMKMSTSHVVGSG